MVYLMMHKILDKILMFHLHLASAQANINLMFKWSKKCISLKRWKKWTH